MEKKELLEKLLLADEEIAMIYHGKERIRVVIVGGGSFIIKNFIKRQTPDIDTMGLYSQLEPIFNKYDINSRANAYSDSLPYNYEDRLEKVDLNTTVVDYYTPSLEDMVIMKLFSQRPKDAKDIENINVISAINWNKLESIVSSGELDYSFDKERLKIFDANYIKYRSKYKKI